MHTTRYLTRLWCVTQIKVPIGGLVPYPKDHKRDKGANVDVVMSPLSMATMVDVNASATVADAYSDAFKSAEVQLNGNAMLAGRSILCLLWIFPFFQLREDCSHTFRLSMLRDTTVGLSASAVAGLQIPCGCLGRARLPR